MHQTHQITPETTITLLKTSDAPQLFQVIDSQREYLSQWLPFVTYTEDISDSEDFIDSLYDIEDQMLEYTFKILHKGKLAGLIGYKLTDLGNLKTEIGYWLCEKHQGLGIMTACVKHLLYLAFNELKLNRVQIKCAKGNAKSSNIPKRLNFTFEGIERAGERFPDGTYRDIEVYSVLTTL